MFYNTGIATYVWVLSNRKPAHRRGKVQLIDATQWYRPLRKNLGKKNCELSEEDILRICDTFLTFKESEQSKIFPNAAFGYWKVTVERPLRLRVDLSDGAMRRFRGLCIEAGEGKLAEAVEGVAATVGRGPHLDYNEFVSTIEEAVVKAGVKFGTKQAKLLQSGLAERDAAAAPVVKRLHKPGKMSANPLYGLFALEGKQGKVQQGSLLHQVVEYEPDPELRDTEQIPLLEAGGIDAFFQREVLPHVPDAWINADATKIGYEINFNRYFYKPQPLRSLAEIRADILALEQETDGLLGQILNLEVKA